MLKEVVRLAPNLSDPYHTLGLIFKELNDEKKSLNFYMIAAHLNPKDSSLWKNLLTQSMYGAIMFSSFSKLLTEYARSCLYLRCDF